MTSPTAYRLSRNVLPTRYELALEPDLTSFTFTGELRIDMTVASPTDVIMTNAAELSVSLAEVELEGGARIAATSATVDEEAESLTIALAEPMPAGLATLHLVFTGTLNDQLRGFYRSRYEAADGSERYLATTQFEATDARRAFPCWDEPNVKAAFDVTLVVPEDLAAISNMPIASEEPASDGKRRVRFETSPKMSTYLLALLVGDLACVEQSDATGVLHRVWATKGKEHQGRFALEHSVRILDYMNDYFGIPFPLPKIDHIAVPDFAAGAMENWGAITYRETALLFDQENSAAQARQRILEVVAHEMAHMWFGDLVTMEWWDDLWLNESFASWMGDKTVGVLYPEWEMWTQFVSHDTNSALALDGLRNSHPIEQEVRDPAEIRELFDAISYSKGGSVLRMLEDYLGAEEFRRGLHDYLDAHSYANARGADLWQALEKASGKPAVAVADAWIKQIGYPVLHASVTRSDGATSIALRQERFTYDHLVAGAQTDSTLWPVPLRVRHDQGRDVEAGLFDEREGTREIAQDSAWVKVNDGQTGFFRVAYSDGEWARLSDAVRAGALPPMDRLSLQDDAYALMRAGHAPATTFLSLAGAYDGETDATVLSDLASNLRGLDTLLWDEGYSDSYRAFAGARFADGASRAGWDARPGEEHLDALFRSTAVGQFGAYGDQATVDEARRRFAGFAADPAALHPDMRGVVYGLVAQNGDEPAYDALWRIYREAPLHEEKMRALGALTRFGDREVLSDLLKRSMDDAQVRGQDAPLVLVQVAMNRQGRDMAWDFLRDEWGEFDRRYGKGGFAIMRMVQMTGSFTTTERASEVEDFFKAHPAPSAARTIQQSLERIGLNAAWLERNRNDIGAWLAAQG